MSEGNLIRTPLSEVVATVELFDRLGITSQHLVQLRKAASWDQTMAAGVIAGDPYLLALLALEIDAKKAGFTKDELSKIDEDRLLEFRNVIRGLAEVKPIEHVIDCDAIPMIPQGWSIHPEDQLPGRVRGLFKLNSAAIKLYRSVQQKKDKSIGGEKLARELENQPVLPANVLDYYLAHQELIPEEHKEKTNGYTTFIFFWGTIFRGSHGDRYVRCLYWSDGGWGWHCGWLGSGWGAYDSAALRAS